MGEESHLVRIMLFQQRFELLQGHIDAGSPLLLHEGFGDLEKNQAEHNFLGKRHRTEHLKNVHTGSSGLSPSTCFQPQSSTL